MLAKLLLGFSLIVLIYAGPQVPPQKQQPIAPTTASSGGSCGDIDTVSNDGLSHPKLEYPQKTGFEFW